jgi:hypothetical protein
MGFGDIFLTILSTLFLNTLYFKWIKQNILMVGYYESKKREKIL